MITYSAHGLNTAFAAVTLRPRIIWLIIFIGSTAFCSYEFSKIIQKFLSHPIFVAQSLNDGDIPFPAVTICNLNPYKKGSMARIPKLAALNTAYRELVYAEGSKNDTTKDQPVKRRRKRSDPEGCPVPPLLKNGHPDKYGPENEGAVVTYACNDHHLLIGDDGEFIPTRDTAALICKEDGSYSPELTGFRCICGVVNKGISAVAARHTGIKTILDCIEIGNNTPGCRNVVFHDAEQLCNVQFVDLLIRPDKLVPGPGVVARLDNFCGTDGCWNATCPNGTFCAGYLNGYTCIEIRMMVYLKGIIREDIANVSMVDERIIQTLNITSNGSRMEYPQPPPTQQALAATARNLLPYSLHDQSAEALSIAGYNQEESIRSCTYNGIADCLWDQFYHQTYGNCYTFNRNLTYRKIVTRAGTSAGLAIVLEAGENDYMDITDSVGWRITFHNPGVDPLPDNDGIGVMPGFQNTFALKYVPISSLPIPYGDCVSSREEISPYFYNDNYSVTACQFSYKQKRIIDECNCTSMKYPAPQGYAKCGIDQKYCAERVEQNVSIINKACKNRCWEEIFNPVVTMTKRPGQAGTCMEATQCEVSSDIADVNVYYGSLYYVSLKEVPRYTYTDMLGDFGGTMGLFLGASVISCVETIYLIGLCMFHISKRLISSN